MALESISGNTLVNITGTSNLVPINFNLGPVNNVTFEQTSVQELVAPFLSYLYQQYEDDPSLQAFINAYNIMAQEYLTWFNTTALGVYSGTNNTIQGQFLDWVIYGIYGIPRPIIPYGIKAPRGPYNTWSFNSNTGSSYNKFIPGSSSIYVTTDDLYARIATWNLYAGDGKQFTIRWLKRRIQRFLDGVNGTDGANPLGPGLGVDTTYNVSVTFSNTNFRQVTINITASTTGYSYIASVLQAAINSGACQLPLGYIFTVTLS